MIRVSSGPLSTLCAFQIPCLPRVPTRVGGLSGLYETGCERSHRLGTATRKFCGSAIFSSRSEGSLRSDNNRLRRAYAERYSGASKVQKCVLNSNRATKNAKLVAAASAVGVSLAPMRITLESGSLRMLQEWPSGV